MSWIQKDDTPYIGPVLIYLFDFAARSGSKPNHIDILEWFADLPCVVELYTWIIIVNFCHTAKALLCHILKP